METSIKVKGVSQKKLNFMESVSIWSTPVSLYWTFVLILGDPEIPIYPFTSQTMWNYQHLSQSYGGVRKCLCFQLLSVGGIRQRTLADIIIGPGGRWPVARIVMTTKTFNDC